MTEDWMYQYPSTSLTTTHKGDRTYAETFHGEANKLLYQLKNLMKFRQLGQLKMVRLFTDGTVITAKSHFGYDLVEIDVSKAIVTTEVSCLITLLDLPDAIPPMKYPGEIHAGEVEGIDYIKTYYTTDIISCPECDDPDFTVCTTEELADDPSKCTPFEFVDVTVESKEGEPNNHCLDPSHQCQAEIISFGEDGEGTYFLWKAYTEWPPEDQSGLGYMVMRGFFKLEGEEEEICNSGSVVIKVDCCEKNSDEYKAVHPELEDLDIEYTSLVMGCDETQEFTAKNGCPPFTWTLVSGGGILTPSEDGLTAIYESPETNPNCASNPTILLEDRCTSKELKLAVNCYGPAYNALVYGDINDCSGHGCGFHGGSWYFCHYNMIVRRRNYSCNGVLQDSFYWKDYEFANCVAASSFDCGELVEHNYFLCGGPSPNCIEFTGNCNDCSDFWVHECGNCGLGLSDRRTDELKAAGCCPLNPETGLPY